MSDGEKIAAGAGVLALVVGAIWLARRPRRVLSPAAGLAGQAYLPTRGNALVAGIAALGEVASKGIDAWASHESNQTQLAITNKLTANDALDAGAQFAADEAAGGFFDAMALH